MPRLKIAVCIPLYGNPEALFMQSLAAMISTFYEAELRDPNGELYEKQLDTVVVKSSMLTENRHRLTAEALQRGADYMLWCDADHVFPAEALCRLWAHGKDIVGCNYARRSKPTAPTACIASDDTGGAELLWTTQEKAEAGLLETVEHLGFGLCLMRLTVLDALQAQAEREGRTSMLPLFHFEPKPDFKGTIGEDVYFFRKCREAGLDVWCDHGLSWELGHVTSQILTNAHTIAHKDMWLEERANARRSFEQRIAALEQSA